MLKTQFAHHESLLVQLLETGALVIPLAALTAKAQVEKIRSRNRNRRSGKQVSR